MATNLVQTINDKEKYIIYYDADVFNQNVTLSIHLNLPKITNTTGHVQFSEVEKVEWNTIYDEQFGTNGSIDGQKTEDVYVAINPGLNEIPFQNHYISLVNTVTYISYGTAGTSGYFNDFATYVNLEKNTIEIESSLYFQDTGLLQITGQDLNYYQTLNNVPLYIQQELSEIAIQIWSLPQHTIIIGEQKVPLGSSFEYRLPEDYDIGNAYTYMWRLRKITEFDTDISNSRAEIVGYSSSAGNTRSVLVHFKKGGYANLEVIIFGPTGCPRIIRKQICIQLPLSKMLVVRNRLI
jgi:hypothetical protein